MKNVLITGGTGLIGKRLSFLLKSKGYNVRLLSRNENSKSPFPIFVWNIENGHINEKAFEDLDYIVGDLGGQKIIIAITGVGIKRARTTTGIVIQKFKPSLIIFGGFGGALSPDLGVGDIVVSDNWMHN